MTDYLGPRPSVNFKKMVAHDVLDPLSYVISGEFTTEYLGVVLGSPRANGKVTDVWWSVKGCGRDDDNMISGEVDVLINGTSCLTTKPSIRYVSGELSQHKTTKITGDTGITQAVINNSANSFTAGDVITCDVILTAESSPDTKMNNAVVVVELEPT